MSRWFQHVPSSCTLYPEHCGEGSGAFPATTHCHVDVSPDFLHFHDRHSLVLAGLEPHFFLALICDFRKCFCIFLDSAFRRHCFAPSIGPETQFLPVLEYPSGHLHPPSAVGCWPMYSGPSKWSARPNRRYAPIATATSKHAMTAHTINLGVEGIENRIPTAYNLRARQRCDIFLDGIRMAQVHIRTNEPAQPVIGVRNDRGGAGDIRIDSSRIDSSRPSSAPPGPPPRPRPPVRPPHSPAPAQVDPDDLVEAMRGFANPAKVRSASPSPESRDEGDDEDMYDEEAYTDDGGEGESPDAMVAAPRFAAPAPIDKPSAGFLTIEDEKADIMFKLQRLKKNGVSSGRTFGMHNDVREMRAELVRVRTELELERSLKYSRRALVGVANALEFFNDKIDILDLELDGWSDHMHQAVYSGKDYDDVLEELFYKYRGKVSMPPEVRLIMAVGGSALQFHMTKLAVKSHAEKTARGAAEARRTLTMTARPKPRTEMRGPSVAPVAPVAPPVAPSGIGGFMGSMPLNLDLPVSARELRVVQTPATPHDDELDAGGSDGGFSGGFDGASPTESDRLSDVPSDLESVPSRMSSPGEDARPAKRRRAPKSEKKVIEL